MVHFALNSGLIQKVLRKSPVAYNNYICLEPLSISAWQMAASIYFLFTLQQKGSLAVQIHAYCLICRITRHCFSPPPAFSFLVCPACTRSNLSPLNS